MSIKSLSFVGETVVWGLTCEVRVDNGTLTLRASRSLDQQEMLRLLLTLSTGAAGAAMPSFASAQFDAPPNGSTAAQVVADLNRQAAEKDIPIVARAVEREGPPVVSMSITPATNGVSRLAPAPSEPLPQVPAPVVAAPPVQEAKPKTRRSRVAEPSAPKVFLPAEPVRAPTTQARTAMAGKYQVNGFVCSECKEPQYRTPVGEVCELGHLSAPGEAPSLQPINTPAPAKANDPWGLAPEGQALPPVEAAPVAPLDPPIAPPYYDTDNDDESFKTQGSKTVDLEKLRDMPRLKEVLEHLYSVGITSISAMFATCTDIKDKVPVLQTVKVDEDRIRRTCAAFEINAS